VPHFFAVINKKNYLCNQDQEKLKNRIQNSDIGKYVGILRFVIKKKNNN
jgi:hypothetical protein